MFKRVRLLVSWILVLTAAGTAFAQGPVQPLHTEPTWQAMYWNNTTLSGPPVLVRQEGPFEGNLDYYWGTGSPDPSIHPDNFSARWTRYIDVPPGTYRFTATSDDGIRVFVDGELILNDWSDHPARTVSADKSLSAGHHLVVVEYYEHMGEALARVSWAPAPIPIVNWRGEYFNNRTLSGPPALVRDDAQINFNWGGGSPAPGIIGNDGFSVRWTRTLSLPAGLYRFTMTVDDGGRLWVNEHLLIDAWRDQPATTYTGDIYLPGGNIPIRMEYYENAGDAVAQLSWFTPVTPVPTPPPPPSPGVVIVDDTDPGFVKGGSPTGWHIAYEGYGGRLLWTRNNDRVRPNYNWARWYPSLTPGRYEVFVFIPERYTTTARARYWVSHAGGFTLRIVDQSANGNRWVSLGTYWFNGTRSDYVSLADVTYEPRLTRLIAFDAVKWVPRGAAPCAAPPIPLYPGASRGAEGCLHLHLDPYTIWERDGFDIAKLVGYHQQPPCAAFALALSWRVTQGDGTGIRWTVVRQGVEELVGQGGQGMIRRGCGFYRLWNQGAGSVDLDVRVAVDILQ